MMVGLTVLQALTVTRKSLRSDNSRFESGHFKGRV